MMISVSVIKGHVMSPTEKITTRNGKPADGFCEWLAQGRDALRKGDRTRIDLLIAGSSFLSHNPLERLTVSAICKVAGVAHGTFYLYFKDRNDLVGAVLGAFVDYVQLQMRAAARCAGDTTRNTTEAYMLVFEAHPALMKSLVAAGDAFPEARAAFQRLNHEWIEAVVGSAMRSDKGAPRSRPDLMRRAYALGGMVDQYLTALFVTDDPWVRDLSQDRSEVVDMLTDLWKRGMAQ
jgi:AcrR family transcriptional regulator